MPNRKPKAPKNEEYQKEPEPHEEEGGAVQVHQAFLEHRLKGGAPATPQAFRSAIEQFQKLPGATRSVPPLASPESPQVPTNPPKAEEKGEAL